MKTFIPLLVLAGCGGGTPAPAPPGPSVPHNPDFDFEIGTWHTHLKRLDHPLTGSTTWIEMDGTSVIRKVWDGRANLVELEVSGPGGHVEGLTLRLFVPNTSTWSLIFANARLGSMSAVALGKFVEGRGVFYVLVVYDGRTIFVK